MLRRIIGLFQHTADTLQENKKMRLSDLSISKRIAIMGGASWRSW